MSRRKKEPLVLRPQPEESAVRSAAGPGAGGNARQAPRASAPARRVSSAAGSGPHWGDWAAAGLLGLAALLCFQHPDIWETSNHSWILLECISSGRFLDFYQVVGAHEISLYYVNGANYNITLYLLFALWQLPVWLVCKIGGFAVNEYFLLFWSKALCAGGLVLCCRLLTRLAKGLGLSEAGCRWAGLLLFLWPAAFFSTLIMGQYDVFCLAATLIALLHYQKGRLRQFTAWMGAAALFKFFPLLLFLPLLLLAEKRPAKLVLHGLGCLWLLAPTTLLFLGRTDGAVGFTLEMAQRLFAMSLPGGMRDLPIFVVCYGLGLIVCWFWRVDAARLRGPLANYICFSAYALMLLCIRWHPQWVSLIAPFWLLGMLLQKERLLWLALDWVFSAGYFLLLFFEFPYQMDANLFDYGLITLLTGRVATQNFGRTTASVLLEKIPLCVQLSPALFALVLLAALLLWFPTRSGSLAARLGGGDSALAVTKPVPLRLWAFSSFGVGVFCFAGSRPRSGPGCSAFNVRCRG